MRAILSYPTTALEMKRKCRISPVAAAAALFVVTALSSGCKDRPAAQESSAKPESASPNVAPTIETSELRQARIRADDGSKLEVVDIELVDAPDFKRPGAGSPKALMRGKHLRLDPEGELGADRGLVAVQVGSSYASDVLELRVLDLESGAVLVALAGAYPGTYRKLGLAFGRADVGGTMSIVLLHAGDGKLVPLWPYSERDEHTALVHPATGDGWVFDRVPGPADEAETIAIAPWPNLREPPPAGNARVVGGFPVWETDRPRGWYGSGVRDPAPAPMLIEPQHAPDDCPKIALEGSRHRCVGYDFFALSAGWEVDFDASTETLRATNPERREVQRLELGEDCRVSSVSLDPPRAIIQCSDEEMSAFLWAPERTLAVPAEVFRGPTQWGRNGHVAEVDVPASTTGEPGATYWLDVVRERALRYRPVSLLTPYAIDRYAIVEDPPGSNHLFAVEIEAAQTYALPIDGHGCTRLDTPATEFPWVAVGCYDAQDRVRRIDVVDLAGHRIWRLPALREMWLQPERSRVVGLLVAGSETRVVSWTFG